MLCRTFCLRLPIKRRKRVAQPTCCVKHACLLRLAEDTTGPK